MLELTDTDPASFYDEVGRTSLHYGYFAGMPRLKEAIAGLFTDAVTPEMVTTVHGGTGANSIVCCLPRPILRDSRHNTSMPIRYQPYMPISTSWQKASSSAIRSCSSSFGTR